jgi:hypothetical protein
VDSLFVALDWIGGILVAAILAMVVLSPSEREAVGSMIVIACAVITSRWVMWAVVTDSSWELRGVIGAVIGALLLIGAPAFWRMSKRESPQNPPIAVTPPVTAPAAAPATSPVPSSGEEAPAFDLSDNAKLRTRDTYLEAVPHGLLRAGGNTEASFDRLTVIDPSIPLKWPSPSREDANLDSATLRQKATSLATQLRAIHAEKQEATRDMGLKIAQLEALYKTADAKADASFAAIRAECLAVGAAIAARENLQNVARQPREVYLGAEAIILGRLSGVDPILNSAIALETLAAALH